jgi:predicted nucleic acid-binding protein
MDDSLRVCPRHHAPRVLPPPWNVRAALEFVEVLRATPSHRMLVESERHASVAKALAETVPGLAGNLFHDFHTAVLIREHGIARVCTRDADFRRFRFLEVIDPLA